MDTDTHPHRLEFGPRPLVELSVDIDRRLKCSRWVLEYGKPVVGSGRHERTLCPNDTVALHVPH